MNVLVLGASGFVGSRLIARLAADGYRVRGISRGRIGPGVAAAEHVPFDIARAVKPDDWLAQLSGIEAVVNCAGTLQDSPGESTQGVHATGIAALVAACEHAGIRRFVQLSAMGVERRASPFARSKLAGDEALMRSRLDWVILRPSVIIGRAAYGGSALLRGLAALPLEPLIPGTAPVQPVHLDDVIDTILFLLRRAAPTREVLALAGPRAYAFNELVRLVRRGLRLRPAPSITVPPWLAAIAYRLGDAASLLGWRPPLRTTARTEIEYGATGDPAPWTRLTGIVPRDIEQGLAAEPASVQERWFARLYFLKPLALGVLALFWITTGVISFGPGWNHGIAVLTDAGMAPAPAAVIVTSGALLDVAVGLLILFRRTCRSGLVAALGVSVLYVAIGTGLTPALWADPLGPLLKVAPILVLNLVALAILDDR